MNFMNTEMRYLVTIYCDQEVIKQYRVMSTAERVRDLIFNIIKERNSRVEKSNFNIEHDLSVFIDNDSDKENWTKICMRSHEICGWWKEYNSNWDEYYYLIIAKPFKDFTPIEDNDYKYVVDDLKAFTVQDFELNVDKENNNTNNNINNNTNDNSATSLLSEEDEKNQKEFLNGLDKFR